MKSMNSISTNFCRKILKWNFPGPKLSLWASSFLEVRYFNWFKAINFRKWSKHKATTCVFTHLLLKIGLFFNFWVNKILKNAVFFKLQPVLVGVYWFLYNLHFIRVKLKNEEQHRVNMDLYLALPIWQLLFLPPFLVYMEPKLVLNCYTIVELFSKQYVDSALVFWPLFKK